MPWIPFEKFILPLCQLSLICAKAVRQHYWFRRLAHTIHGVGVILLISNKRSIEEGVIRQLLLESWWKDPWARQMGEHRNDGPYFSGETDFWHWARTMHKSNMRKNLQPTSEAPMKSRTHTPTWLQVEKEQCNYNSAHAECRARENLAENRLYDIFSDTGFKLYNCICRSLESGTWCVLLNDKICPPPWQHTWERAQPPIIGVWFPLEHGSKLCSTWEEAGAGCPMRQECEDCGVAWCWKARDWNTVWHVLAGETGWKTNFCPWKCMGGTKHTPSGRGKSSEGFLSILIFLWSMELMAGFPQQLFFECFWFPWKSPSAPASAAWQATACLPQEGAQRAPEGSSIPAQQNQ